MRNIRERLVDVQLVEEDRSFYLDVKYEYENENGIYEVRYPRVLLTFCSNALPAIDRSWNSYEKLLHANFGFGNLLVSEYHDPDRNADYNYIVNTIKEKTHKMTVAEIEAKLGYKIEIVSEKEEDVRVIQKTFME